MYTRHIERCIILSHNSLYFIAHKHCFRCPTMQFSSWQLLSVLCVLSCDSCNCSASPGLRCVDPEQLVAGAAVTRTTGGDIVGTRYTYLDPRQNKSVTWTAYYVSTTPAPWNNGKSGAKLDFTSSTKPGLQIHKFDHTRTANLCDWLPCRCAALPLVGCLSATSPSC